MSSIEINTSFFSVFLKRVDFVALIFCISNFSEFEKWHLNITTCKEQKEGNTFGRCPRQETVLHNVKIHVSAVFFSSKNW